MTTTIRNLTESLKSQKALSPHAIAQFILALPCFAGQSPGGSDSYTNKLVSTGTVSKEFFHSDPLLALEMLTAQIRRNVDQALKDKTELINELKRLEREWRFKI